MTLNKWRRTFYPSKMLVLDKIPKLLHQSRGNYVLCTWTEADCYRISVSLWEKPSILFAVIRSLWNAERQVHGHCIPSRVITEDSGGVGGCPPITRCHPSAWLTCFPAVRRDKDAIKPVSWWNKDQCAKKRKTKQREQQRFDGFSRWNLY